MTFSRWWCNWWGTFETCHHMLQVVELYARSSKSSRKRRTARPGIRRRYRLWIEPLESRYAPANASGILSGATFIDQNNNGIFDTGEKALPGIVMTLTGTTTQNQSVSASATTDANGSFTFINLLPGTYNVSAAGGPTLVNGKASAGSVTAPAGTDAVSGIQVSGGQTINASFGFRGLVPSVISLRQFLADTTSADFPPPAPAGSGTGEGNVRANNAPTVSAAIADFTVGQNSADTVIDLAGHFTDPDFTNSQVRLDTSGGAININLFDAQAPQTVANFFDYINSGAYNNSIFHRLATGFVLQGGGFTFDNTSPPTLTPIPTHPNVPNEFGASNTLGTVAMAKLGSDQNSATDQFFFNLVDSSSNLDLQNGGFTVFGQLAGSADQAVVNTLKATPINTSEPKPFDSIPLNNYSGTNFPSDTTAANYILINDVVIVKQDEYLTYKYSIVSSTTPDLVTLSLATNTNEFLNLHYAPGQSGSATINVRATDKFGASVDSSFTVTVAPTAATTTTLTSSPNSSTSTLPVAFTASVSAGSGTPTGTVTFLDGSSTLGTVALSSGSATFTTSGGLTTGRHAIQAIYSGDGTFTGSTSAPFTQIVM